MNDVQAAGLTAMELAGSIREGLTKYITSPQVTVTVTEINSRRVYVTGEVMRPGAQPLLPNMTALQAPDELRRVHAVRQNQKHAFTYFATKTVNR